MAGCISDVPTDYTVPSPSEVALLGERYRRTAPGRRRQRTWAPSRQRVRANRLIVYVRDDFTCQDCALRIPPLDVPAYAGEAVQGLELDHVVAYVAGGLFYPGNLQALCSPCNNRKGAS